MIIMIMINQDMIWVRYTQGVSTIYLGTCLVFTAFVCINSTNSTCKFPFFLSFRYFIDTSTYIRQEFIWIHLYHNLCLLLALELLLKAQLLPFLCICFLFKKNLLLSVSMQRVENDRDFFRTRLLTALFSVQAYMPKFVVISNFKNTPQYVHTHTCWQQTERTRRNRICTGLWYIWRSNNIILCM